MISVKSDDELIQQFIEKDPYHSGPADVRVRDHHIHVWAIVGDLQNYDFKVDEVARSCDIPWTTFGLRSLTAGDIPRLLTGG